MNKWSVVPDMTKINKTIAALKENGMEALVVKNEEDAKEKILQLIPEGSEVMTMASKTLEALGILEILNDSEKYNSIRNKLMADDVDPKEKKRLGAAPEFTIGSVHAVTEDGHVFIASNTGSQLAAYVYGAEHVIWVVGAQKIVSNNEEAQKRIYNYTLSLESKRAHEAYGVEASFVSKMLIINKEIHPGRITLIFINENLGF